MEILRLGAKGAVRRIVLDDLLESNHEVKALVRKAIHRNGSPYRKCICWGVLTGTMAFLRSKFPSLWSPVLARKPLLQRLHSCLND